MEPRGDSKSRALRMAEFFTTLKQNGVPDAVAENLTGQEFDERPSTFGPNIHIHAADADPEKIADQVMARLAREVSMKTGGQP